MHFVLGSAARPNNKLTHKQRKDRNKISTLVKDVLGLARPKHMKTTEEHEHTTNNTKAEILYQHFHFISIAARPNNK